MSFKTLISLNKVLKMLLISCLFFVISCSSDSDDNGSKIDLAVTNIKIYDVENSGTATDILVEFNAPVNSSSVSEYRIFIYKSDISVSTDYFLNLTSSKYLKISSVGSSNYSKAFTENVIDTDGEEIGSEITYQVSVVTIGDTEEEVSLSEESEEFDLRVTTLVDTIAENIDSGTGGLSLDEEGNIYLGDFGFTFNGGGDKVIKITPEGATSVFATGLNGAAGNDFDQDGNLFQANITAGTISKIAPDGSVEEYIAPNGSINSPVGVITDGSDLYITNCGSNSIAKINADKEIELIAGSSTHFNCPNGITKDENGNLYVTNFNNGDIIKIASDGTLTTFKTLPGNQVTHPYYSNGYIYAVARGDFRIYRISISTGEEEIVAGSGKRGHRDGAGSDALFTRPNDIVVTADGSTIYINDTELSAADNGQLGPVIIRRIRLFE